MSHPCISIIVPCYNQAHFLSDAIESLLQQTFTDWECIIVNDGSTDNTEEIAQDLSREDERIRVITQQNKGLSAARNTGGYYAKGEFLQFLDADDKIEMSKLAIQLEYLKSHPEIDVVFSDARYFTTEDPQLREHGFIEHQMKCSWIAALWEKPGSCFEKLLSQCIFAVNCPLVKRSVFESVGFWNENLEALEDWEFWLRCSNSNIKFFFNNTADTLALIRMHSVSMSRDSTRMQKAAVEMRIGIGNSLKNPAHRLINFKEGLSVLHLINTPNTTKQFIKLTASNFCLPVFLSASNYLIQNSYFFKIFNGFYKSVVPWSIQQTFKRLFS